MTTSQPSNSGLSNARQEIDKLDKKLLELLAHRRELTEKVIQSKSAANTPIRDQAREHSLIRQRIVDGRLLGLDPQLIVKLFHEIIADSVRLQHEILQSQLNGDPERNRSVRVAFQWVDGAYCHLVGRSILSSAGAMGAATPSGEPDFVGFPSFKETVDAVESGACDFGILPIENTTSGGINEVYDLLLNSRVSIVGEEKLTIPHCLIGREDVPVSHIMANHEEDVTRYIVVSKGRLQVDPRVTSKVALAISTPHTPGALVETLAVFKQHGINLTKLESRPIASITSEEMFYIDFIGNLESPNVKAALDEVTKLTRFLKVLGCFPSCEVTPTEVARQESSPNSSDTCRSSTRHITARYTLDVNVARTESHSPLWVDRGLIERLPQLISPSTYSSCVVVADAGASKARDRVCAALSVPPTRVLSLAGGESQKNVNELIHLWEFFAEQKVDRKSLVITIGGGATSDLVGFAAGTYMRGVAFLNVPSTLLAQVDASIGGKAGINFHGIKNLVGSIAQPVGVVIDIDALETLPEREMRSGFAEVVKHGLIADRAYFDKVTARDCVRWTPDEMVEIVHRSCEIKKAIVECDETEQGPRKSLNFGHSIGHAIESFALAHGPALTHGEAISIGMYGEAYISYRVGKLSLADLTTIDSGLTAAGLPTRAPRPIPTSELRDLISKDKKNVGGEVKWTLLERIGSAVFDVVISEELMGESLAAIQPGATHPL